MPRSLPLNSMAAAAQSEGTAPARNIWRGAQFKVSSAPPSTGPTMEPMRPIPSAQPTPVERMAVGVSWRGESALRPALRALRTAEAQQESEGEHYRQGLGKGERSDEEGADQELREQHAERAPFFHQAAFHDGARGASQAE